MLSSRANQEETVMDRRKALKHAGLAGVLTAAAAPAVHAQAAIRWRLASRDRKSTRLNSSHGYISYAVFCLKKKKKKKTTTNQTERGGTSTEPSRIRTHARVSADRGNDQRCACPVRDWHVSRVVSIVRHVA